MVKISNNKKNMNLKKTIISSIVFSFLAISFSYAQTPLENMAERLIFWLNRGVVILITVATLYFIWAVIQYIREKDATKMKDRQKQMTNGIIGLFVIVSVWGIISILGRTLGTDRGGVQTPPCPPGTFYEPASRRCA